MYRPQGTPGLLISWSLTRRHHLTTVLPASRVGTTATIRTTGPRSASLRLGWRSSSPRTRLPDRRQLRRAIVGVRAVDHDRAPARLGRQRERAASRRVVARRQHPGRRWPAERAQRTARDLLLRRLPPEVAAVRGVGRSSAVGDHRRVSCAARRRLPGDDDGRPMGHAPGRWWSWT